MKKIPSLESMIARGANDTRLQASLQQAPEIYQAAHKSNIARVMGLNEDTFYSMQYDDWIDLRNRYAAWFQLARKAYQNGELPAVVNERAGELLTEYQKVNPFTL